MMRQIYAPMPSVSIHAFRGEGDQAEGLHGQIAQVSIHAFRGEGDPQVLENLHEHLGFNPRLPGGRRPCLPVSSVTEPSFQSTPSGGKATPDYLDEFHPHYVSIHAFRGEGDS